MKHTHRKTHSNLINSRYEVISNYRGRLLLMLVSAFFCAATGRFLSRLSLPKKRRRQQFKPPWKLWCIFLFALYNPIDHLFQKPSPGRPHWAIKTTSHLKRLFARAVSPPSKHTRTRRKPNAPYKLRLRVHIYNVSGQFKHHPKLTVELKTARKVPML